jgi:hypothetical protein
VVGALALVAAIAIDPRAMVAAGHASASAPTPTPASAPASAPAFARRQLLAPLVHPLRAVRSALTLGSRE